jgi:subtilisin family serine protease
MAARADWLQLDPRLRQELLLRSGSPDGPAEGEAAADDRIPVVARLDPEDADVPGLVPIARFGPVVTARLRLADIIDIRRNRAVRSMKAGRVYRPALAASVPEVRGTAADLRAVTPAGLTGGGVVIAVLDWGLDFTHANFRRADGGTRLLALWDQRGGRTESSPEPFGYGREFDARSIDAALAAADPYRALRYDPADVDPGGQGTHGTHVTDIAAGNGRARGSSPGLAPGASLLFAHLRGDDTRPEDALGDSVRLLEATAWAVARAEGRPLVIHMSLGRTGGPHDASPLVVRAFDHLLRTTSGVAVVMSCGNYRDSRMHARLRVAPGERLELPWEIRDAGPEGAELELWYSGTDGLDVSLYAPCGRRVADLPLGQGFAVRDRGRLIASGFHRWHDPNNAANQVDLFVLSGAPAGTWTVQLGGRDVRDGRVDAWIERVSSRHQSRFPAAVASEEGTTGSICNGWLPIAVGAYDARADGRPSMHFSSRGPTRDGRRKPDVAAPGGAIVAARSSTRLPDGTRAYDGVVAKSGTSMAAPHVSGAVALLFECVAPRRLPTQVVRWMLLETARRDPRSSETTDMAYGAGRLDVRAACTLAHALVQEPAAVSEPGPARPRDSESTPRASASRTTAPAGAPRGAGGDTGGTGAVPRRGSPA